MFNIFLDISVGVILFVLYAPPDYYIQQYDTLMVTCHWLGESNMQTDSQASLMQHHPV